MLIHGTDGMNPMQPNSDQLSAESAADPRGKADTKPRLSAGKGIHTPRCLSYTRTVAAYVAYFCLGASMAVPGSTLVSMEHLLQTDLAKLAAAFAGMYCGQLIGAVICGALYDRIGGEVLLLLSSLTAATSLCVAPLFSQLWSYVVALSIFGITMGVTGTGDQLYVLDIWRSHRRRSVFVQALHCLWTAGFTMGAIFSENVIPDLTHINSQYDDLQISGNNTNGIFSNSSSATIMLNTSSNLSYYNISAYPKPNINDVKYAYLIGLTHLLPASLFIVGMLMARYHGRPVWGRSASIRNREKTEDMTTGSMDIPSKFYSGPHRTFKVTLFALICLIYAIYPLTETSVVTYMATFAVKHLGWPNHRGPALTSAVTGSMFVGRVAGVLLSALVSCTAMLIANLTLSLLGAVILLFCWLHDYVVWIGAVFLGLGSSTLTATVFLFAAQHLYVTGLVTSSFTFSNYAGGIIIATALGPLMQVWGHGSFLYVALAGTVLQSTIFVAVLIITWLHRKKKGQTSSLSSVKGRRESIIYVSVTASLNRI